VESQALWVYVAASLALIATPGQDMIYVVTRSLAQGRVAGLASAVGVCLGVLAHTALAALGVGAILQASEGLFLALKLVGAAYLVYLGVAMLFARAPAIDLKSAGTRQSVPSLVGQGILSNLTNPKIVLFFFAFLPQFVDPASTQPTRDLVFLGVLYAVLALPIKCAVGFAAGSFSERVLTRPSILQWMNRTGGAILVALGMRIAAEK
jgi:threonine/homoserine/homoserine lactone efflux protein